MENFLEILRNNQWLFIVVFTIVQLVYVILNTIKTILSVGKGKQIASIMSAVCYAFYTIVLILTVSELNIWVKMLIIAGTNYVGTFISMVIVQKLKKDRLWEIVATTKDYNKDMALSLNAHKIGYNYQAVSNGDVVWNIYSKNQNESVKIKDILDRYGAKYIVHEEQVRL